MSLRASGQSSRGAETGFAAVTTVSAAGHRSQGVGTTIIRAAEELALRRGHHRIGMGVGEDNSRAGALYLRLGYQDTGCRYLDRYHYIDERGSRHEVADRCLFLVKELRDVPG
ncbi:GNAT family N-acetyltransferase [Verrucosispora sp. WMMC514]|nr:GNAT family N-acetyltransferase [Verrucosispora sp. WMMC514]WBB90660.1 GNAT family N-acetyltransferase [Verrucosispora sp. WMMC514]